MSRVVRVIPALTVACALLAPTGTAASVTTCRGEAATIVGDGRAITGTPGRDVVVTNRSQRIDTLAGDDLVCVTGPDAPAGVSHPVQVDLGPGNDVLDGTAAGSWPVQAELGPGADLFEGGAGSDDVRAGEPVPPYYGHADTEDDVLRPGGGSDSVTSGQVGAVNRDVVELGAGIDSVAWYGTWGGGAPIDGGPDGALIRTPVGESTRLDIPAGELRQGTAPPLLFRDVRSFSLDVRAPGLSLTAVGTESTDHVAVVGFDPLTSATADLGAGDDSLSFFRAPTSVSRLDAGSGTDELKVGSADQSLGLDLASGRLLVGETESPAPGFENGHLLAEEVDLAGTTDDNVLIGVGCDVVLRGRGGDDFIRHTTDQDWEGYEFSCRSDVTASGGPGDDEIYTHVGDDRILAGGGKDEVDGGGGDDRILGGGGNDKLDGDGANDVLLGGAGRDRVEGGPGKDRLSGGAGFDRADGGRGRDRCSAERRVRCEG